MPAVGSRFSTLIVAIALVGSGALGAAPPDPFYVDLLEAGARRLALGSPDRAAHDLRLACFGLLDDPAALARGLALLTVASAEAADRAAVLDTFGRLVEVEERFRVVGDILLSTEERRRFSAALAAYVPREQVEAVASLAAFLPPPPPVEQSKKGRRRRARRDSSPLEPAASANPGSTGQGRPVSVVQEGEPIGVVADPVPPPATSASWAELVESTPTTAERQILAAAERGLESATDQAELDRHLDAVGKVLEQRPSMPDAHLLAARLAYRASAWATAVEHFRQGRSLVEQSPSLQFYFAVSLFEIGERAEAAEVLQRALPELAPSPFVERYRSRILD